MFIPLHDANPLRHLKTPYVTRTIVVVTVLVFVVFQSGWIFDAGEDVAAISFGVIPIELLHPAGLRGPLALIAEPLTLVTYTFLHGNWLHLGGNMLFLWVFGDNIEDAMGHARFLAFYLLCGIVAALFHTFALPDSNMMLIGASGAVAGIIAAYVILHPRVKVWVLVLMRIPLRIRAMWAIGAWVVYQVVAVLIGIQDQVAWWSHLGGLLTGAVLIPFFRRPGVPLFDRGLD